MQCLIGKRYGELCHYNQQCKHFDKNMVCELNQSIDVSFCMCNDYHRYDLNLKLCQWCDEVDCRRHPEVNEKSPILPKNIERYNRWYHNMDFGSVFGIWASLLIIGLPMSIFLFLLVIRVTRLLVNLTANHGISVESHRTNQINTIVGHNQIYVTLPIAEVVRSEQPPPPYEELIKQSRLPTYEEALQNMFS
ncbi:uncharacterized protein LOC128958518 [Oppia nitens]|uniref:uncharacterized protein LOC128958518 n=1 Tax=Oppia nitens TaxID=1686743 RepID=UPI0023DCE4A8|nr:uncharacterized protein LOC128958518 [Oppia nitens]